MGVTDIVSMLYKNEGGIKAFYKGVIPNLILVINPIINFLIYEKLKISGSSTQRTALSLFLISSIAKSCATFVTYPILTLRVRLQSAASKTPKFNFLTDLYAGFLAKFTHTVLYNSCMMVTYETLREILRVYMV